MTIVERFRRIRAALSFDVPLPKGARAVIKTAVVLLGLMLAAGAAYTYFAGQDLADNAADPAPVSEIVSPIPKPTLPPPDAKVGASVQMLTTPVTPGSEASMAVHTLPGSTCTIKAELDKLSAKDPGLVSKVADEYGAVSWTWGVAVDAPHGEWNVTVLCSRNGNSGMVIGRMTVGPAD